MTVAGERYWLVFNGEIYNYLELTERLRQAGHEFRSQCDAEVILHAYEEWGPACVEQFNGMWAFAIWDAAERCLFASRDRFGIKPFYYCHADGAFIFASEIKGVLASGLVRAAADRQALAAYLVDGYLDADERTLFDGVQQLTPGHNLHLEGQALRVERYWPSIDYIEAAGRSESSSPAELREMLQDAVALRLRSDVPVGACLSGGLDSSSLLACAHEVAEERTGAFDYRTFTVSFPGTAIDETQYAKDVTERFPCRPHLVEASGEELRRELPALTRAQEIPVPSGSLYAQWRVMAKAHESGMKVLLDGQGGDEVFAGYPLYFPAAAADDFLSLHPIAAWQTLCCLRRYHGFSWPRTLGYFGFNLLPASSRTALRQRVKRGVQLGSELAEARVAKSFSADVPFGSRLARLQWQMLRSWQLPALLHFEDRSSMAFSIETRLPFLDYRLVELGMRLSARAKVSRQQGKHILRQAMADLVPASILERRDKIGFATPDDAWMRGPLGEYLRELARSESLLGRGWLDPDWLRGATSADGGASRAMLWRLAGAELWGRTFLDSTN